MNNRDHVNQQTLRQAIVSVLDYLRHDEHENFLESTTPERAGHIFKSLLVLDRWLRQHTEADTR